MIARAVLAVAAVLAIAWFAVTWHDAHRIAHAMAATTAPHPSRALLESGLAAARSAGALNPDRTTGLTYEVTLDVKLGRYQPALAAVKRLVALEPENAESWAFLSGFSAQRDPALAARALAQVRRLDPRFRASGP